MTLRTILTVAAGAASALVALAPASAQSFTSPRSVTVRYGDLDLASDAGKSRLGARLNHAAASVCGPVSQDLAMVRANATCRAGAVTDARTRIAGRVAALNPGGAVQIAAR